MVIIIGREKNITFFNLCCNVIGCIIWPYAVSVVFLNIASSHNKSKETDEK